MWNQIDWTVVGSQIAGVAVLLAAGWKWLKSHDPKLVSEIPAGVEHVVDGVAHEIEDLAKTPWFASVAATGKLEIKHVTDKLLVSHLGQAASQAVASFGLTAAKTLAALTEGEKGTAIEMVQTALSAVGQKVTPAQALTALQVADSAIQSLASVAQAATARSQALSQSVAPTPAPDAAASA